MGGILNCKSVLNLDPRLMLEELPMTWRLSGLDLATA